MIKAIQEVAHGDLSDTSEAFIKSLSRPIDIPMEKRHSLFAENVSAKIHNNEVMSNLPGAVQTYHAIDDAEDQQHFKKFPVDKVCGLTLYITDRSVCGVHLNFDWAV